MTLDQAAKGVFSAASLAASGFVLSSPGIYSFSGTPAEAQTAIRQLVFEPADGRVALGATETTTFPSRARTVPRHRSAMPSPP